MRRRGSILALLGVVAGAACAGSDGPDGTIPNLGNRLESARAVVRVVELADTGERLDVEYAGRKAVYAGVVAEVLYQGEPRDGEPAPVLAAGASLRVVGSLPDPESCPFDRGQLPAGVLALSRLPVGEWRMVLAAVEGSAGLGCLSSGGSGFDADWQALLRALAFEVDGLAAPQARDTAAEVALLVAWVREGVEGPGPISRIYSATRRSRSFGGDYLAWWALPPPARALDRIPAEIAEILAGVKVLWRIDPGAQIEGVDLVVRGPLGVSYRGPLDAVPRPDEIPARPGDDWEVVLAVAGDAAGTVVARVPWADLAGAYAVDVHVTAAVVEQVLAAPSATEIKAGYPVASRLETEDDYWELVRE